MTPGAIAPTSNPLIRGVYDFATNVGLTVHNQVVGVQRTLTTLGVDLAHVFGFRQVVVTEPAAYGNPAEETQYWVHQDVRSAPLATVAMVWAQLTGQPVNVQAFLDQAAKTDSLNVEGAKIYDGPGEDVLVSDSLELLQSLGVRVTTKYYPAARQSAALSALTVGLQDPTKVMVVGFNGPVDGLAEDQSKIVVVLGVDTSAGTVTLNDPAGADGQGLTMRLDDFLAAWGTSNDQLITTQRAAISGGVTAVIPPARTTTWVWSPPTLGSLVANIAATVVHQGQGVQANLASLSADLARLFGQGRRVPADPPAAADEVYGDYETNKQYWIYQGDVPSCAIMATAGVVGQLTGVMPTAQAILDVAMTTPSDEFRGEVIFYPEAGEDSVSPHYGTGNVDVVKLLNLYGINADLTTFLRSQDQLALQTLKDSLRAGQGAIVSINADAAWKAYDPEYISPTKPPAAILRSDHTVIVTAIDATTGTVYVNDSALQRGQALSLPVSTFVKAWQAGDFSLITAQRPASSSPAPPPFALAGAAAA